MSLSLTLSESHTLTISERTTLTESVKHTILNCRKQRDKINLLTLEAMSLATAVTVRTDAVKQQRLMARCWNTLTGKDRQISTQNQEDLARCAYVAQETFNHLYEQNLFTFEALAMVDHKVQRLAYDLETVQEDIQAIFKVLTRFLKAARKQRAQLDKLRHTVDLHRWYHLLESSRPVWRGMSYSELAFFPKLLCVTNDFFTISKAQWTPDDLHFLEISLRKIGINSDEKVQSLDLYSAYEEDLLIRWLEGVIMLEWLDDYASEETPLALGFAQLLLHPNLEIEAMSHHIQQCTGRDLRLSVSAFDLVKDLLSDLLVLKTLSVTDARLAFSVENAVSSESTDALMSGLDGPKPVAVSESPDALMPDLDGSKPSSVLPESIINWEKEIIGQWRIEEEDVSADISFKKNGTLMARLSPKSMTMRMIMNLYGLNTIDGTWRLNDEKLKIKFHEAPDSWLSWFTRVLFAVFDAGWELRVVSINSNKMITCCKDGETTVWARVRE